MAESLVRLHYKLVETQGTPGILCLLCYHISYNPNDIKQKYCGWCHKFLEDPV